MQPTSKRKAPDDVNPLVAAAKRARKEVGLLHNRPFHVYLTSQTRSNPRQARRTNESVCIYLSHRSSFFTFFTAVVVNGDESSGGLMIVRAPSARPSSSQAIRPPPSITSTHLQTPPSPPRPPSSQSHRPPASTAGPSHPPSKRFRADTADTSSRTAPRVTHGEPTRGDPQVDEDVRRMEAETDDLRRTSRENMSSPVAALRPEFAFPATTSQQKEKQRQKPKQGKGQRQERPGSPESSTREREKERRDSQHQRRSSMGLRGKRISSSFETTGIIGMLDSLASMSG